MAHVGKLDQSRSRATLAHFLRGHAISRSDCAPRSSSTWALIWSYSCHSCCSPALAASGVRALNGRAIAGS